VKDRAKKGLGHLVVTTCQHTDGWFMNEKHNECFNIIFNLIVAYPHNCLVYAARKLAGLTCPNRPHKIKSQIVDMTLLTKITVINKVAANPSIFMV
jgi:hypothetical protein